MRTLDFEKQCLLDVLADDQLVVFARGLGIERLLIKLIRACNDPSNIVIIIGTTKEEQAFFQRELSQLYPEDKDLKMITSEISLTARQKMFEEGGVFFITSRILITDFLCDRIPYDHVAGIIVYKAHRLVEPCQESFILRLYRQKNKRGFIKALSDNALALSGGFAKLERTLRNCFVKKVTLMPRFHMAINDVFEQNAPELTEYSVTMSDAMHRIQTALVDLIGLSLSTIKKFNANLDTELLSTEQALSSKYEYRLSSYLDPIWHQLSPGTRRSIDDIRTLRNLMQCLIHLDCVTFYSTCQQLSENVKTNAASNDWVYLSPADDVFAFAKERVYGRQPRAIDRNQPKKLSLKFDMNPKWEVLRSILEGIAKNEREFARYPVLIFTSDEKTCKQIASYLLIGGEKLLRAEYTKLIGSLDDVDCDQDVTEVASLVSEVTTESDSIAEFKSWVQAGAPTNAYGVHDVSTAAQNDASATLPRVAIVALRRARYEPFVAQMALQRTTPRHVILFDVYLETVRAVEMYQALNPEFKVYLYTIMYDLGMDAQNFSFEIARERDAFHYLIKEKAVIAIPEEYDGKTGTHPDLVPIARSIPTSNTRRGGVSRDLPEMATVVIDMRELRCDLPSALHRRGIKLVPQQLEVGDYIISPDIGIERKSLSDLIGSFKDGRLYNQVQALARYYDKPTLLIEFTDSQPFCLSGRGMSEVVAQNIAGKLALLTIHCPKLRIIWSRSPNFSADMIDHLKISRDEPDPKKTLTVTEGGETDVFKYNKRPQAFLEQLPGVTSYNVHGLMRKFDNLGQLFAASDSELLLALNGNAHQAKQLYDAIHSKLKPSTASVSKRPGAYGIAGPSSTKRHMPSLRFSIRGLG